MQTLAAVPVLRVGLDDVFAACPAPWGGGQGGPLSLGGFRYVGQAEGSTCIAYGPVGWKMLQGFHRAVAAYAHAGLTVVVDDLLLSTDCLADWREALHGLRSSWVQVVAPLAVLEERERLRRQRPGLARGHFHSVHEGVNYDLTLDSSLMNSERCAVEVLDKLGLPLRQQE